MWQASPNGRTCATGMPNIRYCTLQTSHDARPASNTPTTLREPSESVRYTLLPGGDRCLLKTTGGLGTGIGGEHVFSCCTGHSPQFSSPHTPSHHVTPGQLRWLLATPKILFTKRTIRDRFCTYVVRARNTNSDSKKNTQLSQPEIVTLILFHKKFVRIDTHIIRLSQTM